MKLFNNQLLLATIFLLSCSPLAAMNHTQETAQRRMNIIAGHLLPSTNNNLSTQICAGSIEESTDDMDDQFEYFLDKYETTTSTLLKHKQGKKKILDANNIRIGTLYSYSYKLPTSILIVTRLINPEDKILGFCIAEAFTESKKGDIDFLMIDQNERRNGYGKILLAYTTKSLFENGCTSLAGVPAPFDLKKEETKAEMEPKLINFYKQFGAQLTTEDDLPKLDLKL